MIVDNCRMPDNPDILAKFIKSEARLLGFDMVGITIPQQPESIGIYEDWIAKGLYGEMGYLSREDSVAKRANPREILSDCESILVLGARYQPNKIVVKQDSGRGKIASYAWGEDYHTVLIEKIKILLEKIEAYVGVTFSYRYYTDTGPLLERELGQKAGLGWIGKNSCLINPKYGSYFFIAEVLLTLNLPEDDPFIPDHCGSCDRCIKACPTQCILPNRTIDARNCISYLTIELKTAIPEENRGDIGSWIFGCDVCQQVCPWNETFAEDADIVAFHPNEDRQTPTLAEELKLSPQEFNKKFQGSPINRAKRRGYLRNVLIGLGNQQLTDSIPALLLALNDAEPLVRAHAVWALRKFSDEQINRLIHEKLENEADPLVLQELRNM